MPGLFGIVDISESMSPARLEMPAVFAKMAASLRHHDDDRLEEAGGPTHGLLVGRIGLQHLNSVKWPDRTNGGSKQPRLYFAGALTDGAGESVKYTSAKPAIYPWRGFFSAVFNDPQNGLTLIVADRRSSVPLYYAQVGNWLFFAPEVKALLAAPSLPREVDPAALATFLAQGHLLGNQTLFRQVRRLRGGELLRVENGCITLETYWRFTPGSAVDEISRLALEQELCQLVEAATARNLGNPAKTMLFLSGGADSRGILGSALAAIDGDGSRLNTISWGVDEGPGDSDVAVATSIAGFVGTNHRFVQRQVSAYREDFKRVNRLVDGLSDIAAYHPHEYQIMVDLRAAGFERVLRGDEVFGWSFPASTMGEALSLVMLRRLRDARDIGSTIRPEHYTSLCEASDNAIQLVLDEVQDLEPNQAKDYFYYSHRLQCYLQTASYYKQVELDQRNVLLDETILDFMSRVPEPLRIDKRLYRNAMARRYLKLSRFPIAKRNNLEDWSKLLIGETQLRKYACEELSDRSSGIWEYLDPVALKTALRALTASAGALAKHHTINQKLKAFARQTLRMTAPSLLFRIQTWTTSRPEYELGLETLLMRTLVLKDWYDTFVTGV